MGFYEKRQDEKSLNNKTKSEKAVDRIRRAHEQSQIVEETTRPPFVYAEDNKEVIPEPRVQKRKPANKSHSIDVSGELDSLFEAFDNLSAPSQPRTERKQELIVESNRPKTVIDRASDAISFLESKREKNVTAIIREDKSTEERLALLEQDFFDKISSAKPNTLVSGIGTSLDSGGGAVWLWDLDDIDIGTPSNGVYPAISNGSVLVYNSGIKKWQAGAGGGSGGSVNTAGVLLTNPVNDSNTTIGDLPAPGTLSTQEDANQWFVNSLEYLDDRINGGTDNDIELDGNIDFMSTDANQSIRAYNNASKTLSFNIGETESTTIEVLKLGGTLIDASSPLLVNTIAPNGEKLLDIQNSGTTVFRVDNTETQFYQGSVWNRPVGLTGNAWKVTGVTTAGGSTENLLTVDYSTNTTATPDAVRYFGPVTENTHIATKAYVDSNSGGTSNALPLAGGTMTGDITFTDTQVFPRVLPLTGGTLTGSLNVGTATNKFSVNTSGAITATSAILSSAILIDTGSNESAILPLFRGRSADKSRFIVEANGTLRMGDDLDMDTATGGDTITMTAAGAVTAVSFTGDGSGLTGVVAAGALPKTGGTMTGDIVFANSQTFPISGVDLPVASTSVAGIVQLNNATDSTSESLAATSLGLKSAYDRGSLGVTNAATAQAAAEAAQATADAATGTSDAALPKAGGTMTGPIVFSSNQPTGTGSTAGIVKLSDVIDSNSALIAGTANAVRQAYDRGTTGITNAATAQAAADAAQATADAALPLSGGAITGDVTYAGDTSGNTNIQTKDSVNTLIAGATGGNFVFKGVTDVTGTAPSSPNAGDFYINTVAGTADSSWTGIAGSSISADQLIMYSSGESRWFAGAVENNTSYLLKTGGTMTGNIVFAAGQPTGTGSTAGIVKLSDVVDSNSALIAGTANAVRQAYDRGSTGVTNAATAQAAADGATTTANAALPKSGGTMTGDIVFNSGQTFPGAGAVDSVNGETGTVVLSASDVGALPTAGGTMTGNIVFNSGQPFPASITANYLPLSGGELVGTLAIGTSANAFNCTTSGAITATSIILKSAILVDTGSTVSSFIPLYRGASGNTTKFIVESDGTFRLGSDLDTSTESGGDKVTMTSAGNITAAGAVVATSFTGDGSGLTNVAAAGSLPLSGGTMTGDITFNSGQSFPGTVTSVNTKTGTVVLNSSDTGSVAIAGSTMTGALIVDQSSASATALQVKQGGSVSASILTDGTLSAGTTTLDGELTLSTTNTIDRIKAIGNASKSLQFQVSNNTPGTSSPTYVNALNLSTSEVTIPSLNFVKERGGDGNTDFIIKGSTNDAPQDASGNLFQVYRNTLSSSSTSDAISYFGRTSGANNIQTTTSVTALINSLASGDNLLTGGTIRKNGGSADNSGNLTIQADGSSTASLSLKNSTGQNEIILSANDGSIDMAGALKMNSTDSNKLLELLGAGNNSKLRIQIGQTASSVAERVVVGFDSTLVKSDFKVGQNNGTENFKVTDTGEVHLIAPYVATKVIAAYGSTTSTIQIKTGNVDQNSTTPRMSIGPDSSFSNTSLTINRNISSSSSGTDFIIKGFTNANPTISSSTLLKVERKSSGTADSVNYYGRTAGSTMTKPNSGSAAILEHTDDILTNRSVAFNLFSSTSAPYYDYNVMNSNQNGNITQVGGNNWSISSNYNEVLGMVLMYIDINSTTNLTAGMNIGQLASSNDYPGNTVIIPCNGDQDTIVFVKIDTAGKVRIQNIGESTGNSGSTTKLAFGTTMYPAARNYRKPA